MESPWTNFTVAPHLEGYNVPFADFKAANPDLTHFVGGGFVFSQTTSSKNDKTEQENTHEEPLRILLLQRSLSDSYPGCWEGPGGSCDDEDESLLAGVAREVFEESGLRVSKFVDFVSRDKWVSVKPNRVLHVAKFTFIVEVHESGGDWVASGRWQDCVKVDPKEHQAFEWATKEEVQEAADQATGKYYLMGRQPGQTMLKAFQLMEKALA